MTKLTLNGVEVTLTQEQIDQILKENEKKSGYPEYNTYYWYLTSYGETRRIRWVAVIDDNFRFDTGNYYETEEEAEKAAEKLQALARIRKYIRENDLGVVPDWDNLDMPFSPCCYRIGYDSFGGNFFVSSVSIGRFETNIGYIKSDEAAQQVIDYCKDDLLTYFGVTK